MAHQVSAKTRQLRPTPDGGEAQIVGKENSDAGFALERSCARVLIDAST
jgi:hypothetical protein